MGSHGTDVRRNNQIKFAAMRWKNLLYESLILGTVLFRRGGESRELFLELPQAFDVFAVTDGQGPKDSVGSLDVVGICVLTHGEI